MAFKVIISKEYKPHPSGTYKFKRVRSGSFFFGEIREYKAVLPNGRRLRIYWSARLAGEEYAKSRAWGFDKAIMSKLFNEGVCPSHIGVMITADAKRKISDPSLVTEMWLTTVETYKALNINGSLSFDHFELLRRDIDDDVKLKMMKVGGRR